jgi:hypothetical protein
MFTTLAMAVMPGQLSGCSQQQASSVLTWGLIMRLLFNKDWRAYRAGETYDVADPMGEILLARGFAVVEKKPAKRRTKKATKNGNSKKTAVRKRTTGD